MKILFLCHRFPFPPAGGAKVRPFNIIRHLSRQHEVTVVSPVRSEQEELEAAGLAAYCSHYDASRVYEPWQWMRMVLRVPTPIPSSMGYFYSSRIARRVAELLRTQSFDLVFVHCSSMAQYVENVQDIPKILDFADMDSQKWLEYGRHKSFPLSIGYRLEGTKLMRAEKLLSHKFDVCTTITRAELDTLKTLNDSVASDWFPNGVDVDYFSPADAPYEPDTICFVGRMDYYPNQQCMLDFCDRVLPVIQSRRPTCRLLIVGAEPTPEILRLGERSGVTVTGSVHDVRPYLHRSALSVAPMKIARGTQNKILESMAAGVPVVASRIAAAGVDAEPGRQLTVADTDEQMVESILRILDSPEERTRLSIAGRERMETHYTWGRAMARLDGIVERCIPTRVERALARPLADREMRNAV